MHTVQIDPAKLLEAETAVPVGMPVTMLNLISFHQQAQYEGAQQTACSGREAYMERYAPAFTAVAAELGVDGIEVVYVGAVATTILGPSDPVWDAIALVRYPNFAALRKVIESPAYLQKAEPHRKAALKAWEFVATFQPAK